MKIDQALEDARRIYSRASSGAHVLALRSSGAEVTAARRDELLAKARAGEHVELELDVFAFEQSIGSTNRKFVRFRDGAMLKLGSSGKGTPVIRDHEQNDVHARAGTVIASKTEKRGEGDYAIQQTFRLTAPWAVELALRGLLDTVSVGWHPTGPVNCSACNAPVFASCYHLPGDRLAEREGEGGGKRKVRAADGDIVVEWIFTEAELVETSLVSVPAVPSAHIEGIRAALAAGPNPHRGVEPHEEEASMKNLSVLATKLGLAATVGEDEFTAAVEKLIGEKKTLAAQLPILEADVTTLRVELGKHEAAKKKTEEDSFIQNALSSGRIGRSDEEPWRVLFGANADSARTMMDKRPIASATPVGATLQSGTKPADPTPVVATQVTTALAATGADANVASEFARQLGVKPESMAAALGVKGAA